MSLLLGILSLLPMTVSFSASSGIFYLFVFIIFFRHLDYRSGNVLNYEGHTESHEQQFFVK